MDQRHRHLQSSFQIVSYLRSAQATDTCQTLLLGFGFLHHHFEVVAEFHRLIAEPLDREGLDRLSPREHHKHASLGVQLAGQIVTSQFPLDVVAMLVDLHPPGMIHPPLVEPLVVRPQPLIWINRGGQVRQSRQRRESGVRRLITTGFRLIGTRMVVGETMRLKDRSGLWDIGWMQHADALPVERAEVSLDERLQIWTLWWADLHRDIQAQQKTHESGGKVICRPGADQVWITVEDDPLGPPLLNEGAGHGDQRTSCLIVIGDLEIDQDRGASVDNSEGLHLVHRFAFVLGWHARYVSEVNLPGIHRRGSIKRSWRDPGRAQH